MAEYNTIRTGAGVHTARDRRRATRPHEQGLRHNVRWPAFDSTGRLGRWHQRVIDGHAVHWVYPLYRYVPAADHGFRLWRNDQPDFGRRCTAVFLCIRGRNGPVDFVDLRSLHRLFSHPDLSGDIRRIRRAEPVWLQPPRKTSRLGVRS